MAQVQGVCPEKFKGVKDLLENLVASGDELGASITVNIAGEEVLDIWCGYKDSDRKFPWAEDTITHLWSSTKTVLALATLILIDQGKLDPFEKVSRYWPEFGVNGKEDVEVRHFLSHTSGVSAWEENITIEEICDVKTSTAKLAQQAPWWKPGTASGYHAMSMGHLLGELVRRTTGKSLTDFIATEIAGSLEADFQIGAAEKDWPRVSNIVPPPQRLPPRGIPPQDSVAFKTLMKAAPPADIALTPGWRKAELGAANGHSNARGLNRTASIITLGGTVKNKKYMSQKTIDLIFQEQANGIDLAFMEQLRWGMGYGLRSEGLTAWIPKGKVCFWGGWGGSIVIMDLDRQITLTYVMNKMGEEPLGPPKTQAYVHEIYKALGNDSVGTPWGKPILRIGDSKHKL